MPWFYHNASAGPSIPSANPQSNHCFPNTPPFSFLHAFVWPEMTRTDFLPMKVLLISPCFCSNFTSNLKDQASSSSQDKSFSPLFSCDTFFAYHSQSILHLICFIFFVLLGQGLCFAHLHISSKHVIHFT